MDGPYRSAHATRRRHFPFPDLPVPLPQRPYLRGSGASMRRATDSACHGIWKCLPSAWKPHARYTMPMLPREPLSRSMRCVRSRWCLAIHVAVRGRLPASEGSPRWTRLGGPATVGPASPSASRSLIASGFARSQARQYPAAQSRLHSEHERFFERRLVAGCSGGGAVAGAGLRPGRLAVNVP
jgi:hypothetical protein